MAHVSSYRESSELRQVQHFRRPSVYDLFWPEQLLVCSWTPLADLDLVYQQDGQAYGRGDLVSCPF